MDQREMVKLLEAGGVVFCKEGGERWRAAGYTEHLDGVHIGEDIWVALGPLAPPLDDKLKALVGPALQSAAIDKYETA